LCQQPERGRLLPQDSANIAVIYQAQDKYEEAKQMFTEAARICRNVLAARTIL